MTYQSYLTLVNKVKECPQVVNDPQVFRTEMKEIEVSDPNGFAALAAASGAPELMRVKAPGNDPNLRDEQNDQNAALAQELTQRLLEQGMEQHAVIWSVHCWMNALAWPFCDTEHGYDEAVEDLPSSERAALARCGDGWAAASLALMYDAEGDSSQAAWYKTAIDCCDLMTMRRIECAAAESGVQFEGHEQMLARHASLGDPEGIAAYALHLIHTDPQKNREKALKLAYQSSQMYCGAGDFAVYECLGGLNHDGFDVETLADDALESAAEFRYPRACYVRALKRDAQGQFQDADSDLLYSVEGDEMHPAVWDGAVLLARYCMEGKGGEQRRTGV